VTATAEQTVSLRREEILEFCGRNDEKIRMLEKNLGTRLVLRGNLIKVQGDASMVGRAVTVINEVLEAQRKTGSLNPQQFRQVLARASREAAASAAEANGVPRDSAPEESLADLFSHQLQVPIKRKNLSPLTPGQRRYMEAIKASDITFGIGPAGTGKTYLAAAMAVGYLMRGEVRRVILCRPAVEAGEKLGFLPGDLSQKLDPYVRPLWDALYEMVDAPKIKSYLEEGVIEIAPLAYMRGRTLNSSFVILDEGQNTSVEQMKMFLTRLGRDSKGVVTGDVTQIDLPQSQRSGLIHAEKVLSGVQGVSFVRLSEGDVVRHDVVMRIIKAYEAWESGTEEPHHAPAGRRL
jgi:phosphate starvation-inducible PhoH-like protein